MDNRHETEEEMRARLKEELKAELLAELKEEKKSEKKEVTFSPYSSKNETIKITGNSDNGVKEATELLNKDRTFGSDDDAPKVHRLPQAKEGETGSLNIFIVMIGVLAIGAAIYFLPKAYQHFATKETPSTYVDPTPDEEKEPVIELENINLMSESVQNLTYPIMRNNPYTQKTYYTNSVFNIGDMSNNDLLYNAFIHIYNGNIAPYNESYKSGVCFESGMNKTFNAKYIDARMDNLFTKSVEYEFTDFKVPTTNKDTKYVGTWKYDKKKHRYIYYGDCNPVKASKVSYYNLEVAYDAKGVDKNNIIEVYYNVAFASVDSSNKTYNIYSDAAMKNKILSGTLTTTNYQEELDGIFGKYITEQNTAGKYKYTFSNRDCSYQNYCFVKGEWLAEN